MKITTSEDQGVRILTINGRMDLEHYAEVIESFREAMNAERPKIVINLSGVTAISSSGAGAMVRLARDLPGLGGRLALASLSHACDEVFELLHLHDFFTIVSTVEEAVTKVKSDAG